MDNHGYPPMREKSEPFTSNFSVSDNSIKEFPTENPSHPHTVESLPWIQSPLKYSSGDDLYFHPREQASMIELFFDLFFVANLATFTSTHSIVDLDTLWAYLGFFTVIWFTWLQITMHDVRFAIDSFYERLCKAIQFCVFLGFALAGYNFEPWNQLIVYETLCFVLFLSRVLLTIQYTLVLVYVTKSNSKLVKPLIFIVSTFVVSSITFLAMIIASHTGLSAKIYYIWYVMALLEAVAVLSISATWSSLGFGKTHLFERMGLLSMIVVGEGVIGVTKVVGKTMGADGPDIRAVQQAMAIIGILIFLWAIYFDNHPHEGQQLGTKLETFWVAIHFPLHLAFVGIAEGANQIAIAYKTWTYYRKFTDVATATCATPDITSQVLTSTLNSTISYFAFSKYTYSASIALAIEKSLLTLNNTVNPCAPLATTAAAAQALGTSSISVFTNGTEVMEVVKVVKTTNALQALSDLVLGGLHLKAGYFMPELLNGQPKPSAADVFYSAYFVVFGYVFISLAMMFAVSAMMIYFMRVVPHDIFVYVRIVVRTAAMVVCIVVANVRGSILPSMRNGGYVLIAMFVMIMGVILADAVTTRLAMRRNESETRALGEIRIMREHDEQEV